MGLGGIKIYRIVINKNIEYCICIEYYYSVYPIGINIFPIGYSRFPMVPL